MLLENNLQAFSALFGSVRDASELDRRASILIGLVSALTSSCAT